MNDLRINTSASISANALRIHNNQSLSSMNQLATGTKSKNLASNYIQSANATSSVRSLAMGVQNTNQAIALIQSIDTTASLITNQLMEIKDRAMLVTDTIESNYVNDAGILCDFVEFAMESIIEIVNNHSFSGRNFMIGGGENSSTTTALPYTVNTTGSSNPADSIQMTLKSFHPYSTWSMNAPFYGDPANPDMPDLNAAAGTDTHAYGNASLYGGTLARFNADRVLYPFAMREANWHTDTFDGTTHTLIQADRAIAGITAERARLGGYLTQLTRTAETSLDSLAGAKRLKSQIVDTDYAKEVAQLSRSQILAQSAIAMVAQASTNGKSLLSLIQ
jgi:flagellin